MTSTVTNAPTPAPAPPNPPQDRALPPAPPNLARLLVVVIRLLEYGRYLAATVERRATMPAFAIIAGLLGTADLRIILAQLQRGIMRATALETMLLMRAQTGRDVVRAQSRIPTAPGVAAMEKLQNEPFGAQVARLNANRAAYDAPIDPDNLPTQEEIEAEVRSQSIGRTVAAICRDLGVVPGACAHGFWEEIMDAMLFYNGDADAWVADMQCKRQRFEQEQEQDPAVKELAQRGPLDPRDVLGFGVGEQPIAPFDIPLLVVVRPIPPLEDCAAVAAEATGPPPCAALPLAA